MASDYDIVTNVDYPCLNIEHTLIWSTRNVTKKKTFLLVHFRVTIAMQFYKVGLMRLHAFARSQKHLRGSRSICEVARKCELAFSTSPAHVVLSHYILMCISRVSAAVFREAVGAVSEWVAAATVESRRSERYVSTCFRLVSFLFEVLFVLPHQMYTSLVNCNRFD